MNVDNPLPEAQRGIHILTDAIYARIRFSDNHLWPNEIRQALYETIAGLVEGTELDTEE